MPSFESRAIAAPRGTRPPPRAPRPLRQRRHCTCAVLIGVRAASVCSQRPQAGRRRRRRTQPISRRPRTRPVRAASVSAAADGCRALHRRPLRQLPVWHRRLRAADARRMVPSDDERRGARHRAPMPRAERPRCRGAASGRVAPHPSSRRRIARPPAPRVLHAVVAAALCVCTGTARVNPSAPKRTVGRFESSCATGAQFLLNRSFASGSAGCGSPALRGRGPWAARGAVRPPPS